MLCQRRNFCINISNNHLSEKYKSLHLNQFAYSFSYIFWSIFFLTFTIWQVKAISTGQSSSTAQSVLVMDGSMEHHCSSKQSCCSQVTDKGPKTKIMNLGPAHTLAVGTQRLYDPHVPSLPNEQAPRQSLEYSMW